MKETSKSLNSQQQICVSPLITTFFKEATSKNGLSESVALEFWNKHILSKFDYATTQRFQKIADAWIFGMSPFAAKKYQETYCGRNVHYFFIKNGNMRVIRTLEEAIRSFKNLYSSCFESFIWDILRSMYPKKHVYDISLLKRRLLKINFKSVFYKPALKLLNALQHDYLCRANVEFCTLAIEEITLTQNSYKPKKGFFFIEP